MYLHHKGTRAGSKMLDNLDKQIINELQKGLPLVHSPYQDLSQKLNIPVSDILKRLESYKNKSYLSRFGPLFNIERAGGQFLLAAQRIPESEFEAITEKVNAFEEVAHNYKRGHDLNMWFVIAVEKKEDLDKVCQKIELSTGYPVYPMPKLKEYYVNLYFDMFQES